jgi:hypothetical protein
LSGLQRQEIERRRAALSERIASAQRWYVAMARPSAELVAERMLIERGVTSYCPTRAVEQVASKRRVTTLRLKPLFPRYLFTACALRFPDVTVTGILTMPDNDGVQHPILAPLQAIARLAQLETARALDAQTRWRIGDEVDVSLGGGLTLRGMIALVSRRKVEVLATMLGHQRVVKAAIDQISRAA